MSVLFAESKPESGAVISACGTYRYHLWRKWDCDLPTLVFVMMNPSTADAEQDDPTIRRCIGFAKRDGFGSISVRNVFALRATNPAELMKHPDPFGPENEDALLSCRNVSIMNRLVVAWGSPKGGRRLREYYKRAGAICCARGAYCFGTNSDGSPKHPLYLSATAELEKWTLAV